MATLQIRAWDSQFDVTSDWFFTVATNGGFSSASGEADVEHPWDAAGTFSHLLVPITANNRTAAAVFTLQVNNLDGNLTVSVPSATTGTFEDTTNSDTVSSGDTLSLFLDHSGTGTTFKIGPRSLDFAPSGGDFTFYVAGSGANLSSPSASFFFPIVGGLSTGSFTETHYEIPSPAGTYSGLACAIRTNGRGTTSNHKFRVNGADGNQINAIGAGVTGFFQDTTNSDTVSDDDLVDYVMATGTGGGNIRFWWSGVGIAPSSSIFCGVAQGGGGPSLATGAPLFNAPDGPMPFISTEADAQAKITQPATLADLRVFVFSNGATSDSTVRPRINGADGNLLATITGATTGAFVDTTNSDSLVADDLLCWEVEIGSGGTGTAQLASIVARQTPAAAPAAPDAWYPVVAPARLAHPARRGGGWIPPSTPAIQARAA